MLGSAMAYLHIIVWTILNAGCFLTTYLFIRGCFIGKWCRHVTLFLFLVTLPTGYLPTGISREWGLSSNFEVIMKFKITLKIAVE